MKPVKLLVVAVLVVLAALGITAAATAQSDDEKVVLTIGLTQDLDTPNPTVSELVSSYELNTVRYATLTDLAAADFSTTPGLAESWSSEDGKTWTYTLREGLEWSDGTPLTAEDVAYTINRSRDEEWLNYTSTDGESRRRRRRTTSRWWSRRASTIRSFRASPSTSCRSTSTRR